MESHANPFIDFNFFPNHQTLSVLKKLQSLQEEFYVVLKNVAYGLFDKVKMALDQHPELVLLRGDTQNRGGLIIDKTTLLECALGASDFKMAAMIADYFSRIPNVDNEKEKQITAYRSLIENMFATPAYDFQNLFDVIKCSSSEDVKAALAKNFELDTPLNAALIAFREEIFPVKISSPCMHYNYATLIAAYQMLQREWSNLTTEENNHDKQNLVLRQILGYLQRGLPTIDRFAFASAYYENEAAVSLRSLEFVYVCDSFPDTIDATPDGLGFDFFIFEGATMESDIEDDWIVGGNLTNGLLMQRKQQEWEEAFPQLSIRTAHVR